MTCRPSSRSCLRYCSPSRRPARLSLGGESVAFIPSPFWIRLAVGKTVRRSTDEHNRRREKIAVAPSARVRSSTRHRSGNQSGQEYWLPVPSNGFILDNTEV